MGLKDEDIDIFIQLGLTTRQAEVYLTICKIGEATELKRVFDTGKSLDSQKAVFVGLMCGCLASHQQKNGTETPTWRYKNNKVTPFFIKTDYDIFLCLDDYPELEAKTGKNLLLQCETT